MELLDLLNKIDDELTYVGDISTDSQGDYIEIPFYGEPLVALGEISEILPAGFTAEKEYLHDLKYRIVVRQINQ